MKRFLGFLAISGVLAFVAVPFATSDENTPQHCERKDPNDPNSEEICIPLPSVPSPSPQPQPAPGGSSETPEEPAPEAWESPNAGSDDTSSGMPEKPAKEPSSSGVGTGNSGDSSSGSEKPSVASSSSGGKKPAGSDTSSSDSDDSTSGLSRPDTVCGGQFCGSEDSLVNGPGASADRWPNRHPAQNTDGTPGVTSVGPVDDTTPEENTGTVVATDDGAAIHTRDGLIALSPGQADKVTPGDAVDVREVERPGSAQDRETRPGQENSSANAEGETSFEAAVASPEEAAPILLLGVIAGMLGLFIPDKNRKRNATSVTKDATAATTGLSTADMNTHRALPVTLPTELPGGYPVPTARDILALTQGVGAPPERLPVGSQVSSVQSWPSPFISRPGVARPGADIGRVVGNGPWMFTGDTRAPDGHGGMTENSSKLVNMDTGEVVPSPVNPAVGQAMGRNPDYVRTIPTGEATIDSRDYLVVSGLYNNPENADDPANSNHRPGQLEFNGPAYVVDVTDPHHPGQPRLIPGLEQVDIAQLPDGRVLVVGDRPGTGVKVMLVSGKPANQYGNDSLGWVDDLHPIWELPPVVPDVSVPGWGGSLSDYYGTVGFGSSVNIAGRETPTLMLGTALEVLPDGQIVMIESSSAGIWMRLGPSLETMPLSPEYIPLMANIPDPTSVVTTGEDNITQGGVGFIPIFATAIYGPTIVGDPYPAPFGGWYQNINFSQWVGPEKVPDAVYRILDATIWIPPTVIP